jgi:hypothetical protein
MSDVTRLLDAAAAGDPKAARDLLPVVQDELRKLATARLAAEKSGQTLQPTALVHEAYVRLVGDRRAVGLDLPNGRHVDQFLAQGTPFSLRINRMNVGSMVGAS